MKKEYIAPKIIARDIKLDVVMIDMSNGTNADPNVAVDSKRGYKSFYDEEDDYEF